MFLSGITSEVVWFRDMDSRSETGNSKEIDETGINRKEESIMRKVRNISVKEILSMERSFPAFLLLIDTITELAKNEDSNPEAKDNELLLFQRLLENYPELPFYKFAELFQLVGRNLRDEDYQRLVTFAFHKQGNLNIHGRTGNM